MDDIFCPSIQEELDSRKASDISRPAQKTKRAMLPLIRNRSPQEDEIRRSGLPLFQAERNDWLRICSRRTTKENTHTHTSTHARTHAHTSYILYAVFTDLSLTWVPTWTRNAQPWIATFFSSLFDNSALRQKSPPSLPRSLSCA